MKIGVKTEDKGKKRDIYYLDLDTRRQVTKNRVKTENGESCFYKLMP